MKDAPTCILCKELSLLCACKLNLAHFLQVLMKADERNVSTNKNGSEVPIMSSGRGLLDKLNLRLSTPLLRNELIGRLVTKKIPHRITKLRGGNYFLKVGNCEDVYLQIGHINGEAITRVSSRPSAFLSFGTYYEFLKGILGSESLDGASITRMDFAVDFPMPLKRMLRGLEINNKRSRVQYMNESSKQTGILVGTGNEKLLVYDKALEANLKSDSTRIECQLSGNKLPIKKFEEIKKLPDRLNKMRPFHNILLNDFHRIDLAPGTSINERERFNELIVLVEHEGFLFAKKKLNEWNNFSRNYGKFFNLVQWKCQPEEILKKDMDQFIQGGQ